jgi:hypothetical protein
MIYIDATELRINSRLGRHIEPLSKLFGFKSTESFIEAASRTNLESLTGADVMLTPLTLPITGAALVRKHTDAGAVFIQLKFGRDLPGSLGDRMKESLYRMRGTGAVASQCVLTYVGTLTCGKDGWAAINGRVSRPRRKYSAIMTAIWHWVLRGGVYYPVTKEESLPNILAAMDNDVKVGNVTEFWTERVTTGFTDDPLESLEKIEDWRVPFANISSLIGPARATSLMEAMKAKGATQNLGQALLWTSSPKKIRDEIGVPKMRLWGPKSFEAVREAVFGPGEEMFYLNVEVVE